MFGEIWITKRRIQNLDICYVQVDVETVITCKISSKTVSTNSCPYFCSIYGHFFDQRTCSTHGLSPYSQLRKPMRKQFKFSNSNKYKNRKIHWGTKIVLKTRVWNRKKKKSRVNPVAPFRYVLTVTTIIVKHRLGHAILKLGYIL